ncbi:hypothetical protein ACWGLF_31305 [Streptomyces puniciscabiei]
MDNLLTIGLGAIAGRVMGDSSSRPADRRPAARPLRPALGPGRHAFKEYVNLSVIDAIKARTTYTTVLSVLGLGGVLAMESILDALNV